MMGFSSFVCKMLLGPYRYVEISDVNRLFMRGLTVMLLGETQISTYHLDRQR